jgi:hypothetical protein
MFVPSPLAGEGITRFRSENFLLILDSGSWIQFQMAKKNVPKSRRASLKE